MNFVEKVNKNINFLTIHLDNNEIESSGIYSIAKILEF